jgi:excisionase family DNA binding protein
MDDHTRLLLGTAEVADLLGISVRTVCVWAECSELPAYKVGRQWRFPADAIQTWLETIAARSEQGKKRGASASRSAVAASAAGAAYSSGNNGRILL